NVLVRGPADAPEVKVIDWGIAVKNDPTRTRMTYQGLAMGSFGCKDPAVMIDPDRPHTPQSDFYSLGVMLYEVLVGQSPIVLPPNPSPLMMHELLCENNVTPPHQVRPEITGDLEKFLLHLLATRPEDRPQSARAIIQIIEKIEQGVP